jgi:hypothetical protein
VPAARAILPQWRSDEGGQFGDFSGFFLTGARRPNECRDRTTASAIAHSLVDFGWRSNRGRVTQDIDIVLPADRIDEFVRLAGVSEFDVLPQPEGRWPKARHKDTDVQVDILPENARPGSTGKLAPTTIRHALAMGGQGSSLAYVTLPALVELKIAAGRIGDEHDVVELIRTNPDQVEVIRAHLATIHADYVRDFDELLQRANAQEER